MSNLYHDSNALAMKRTIWLCLALQAFCTLSAQEVGRIHRTEMIPYDTRQDAVTRNRASSGYTIDFAPSAAGLEGKAVVMEQNTEIPYIWTDGNIYLHMEHVGTAYTLRINGRIVAEVEDPSTPAEFALTPFIRQGKNTFQVVMRSSRAASINVTPATAKPFEGSYLYYQNKRSIRDFEVALVPDTAGRDFGMLDLKIIVQNSFNYEEPVTIGYDIYSPAGKLLEFNVVDTKVAGQSVDTLHFQPYIYGTYNYKWEAGKKNPPLYDVMLFTKRHGAYKEYMPLKLGFGKTEFQDGKFMRFGKELKLKSKVFNATVDAKTTETQLKTLRTQGYNTLTPDYPQPAWFYELCDKLGMYVIDKANINAPEKCDDRKVGGTPSNDPALVGEYLERVKAMYYRSRNFTCVIAYALGGDSGNGYNMYKAYEWLKSVEHTRPIIYRDAAGEWNSDL